VVNLGDEGFRVVDAICSHAHYFLDEGEVDVEDQTIECPKHGSTFDLNTGSTRTLPATQPVDGYVVEIIDGVVPEYLAAARRTMDAEAAAEFEQNVRGMYDQMARIAITPHWVRYYDFGAGRMPR